MSDPPMLPYPDSTRWFESGPEPILNTPDQAVLIVRVGMAANAIAGQLRSGVAAQEESLEAVRHLGVLLCLVGGAALIHESIKLVKHNRDALMSFANEVGVKPDVVANVKRLCDGVHPANAVIFRARNKIGFHWDPTVIGNSVKEYGRNETIVWVEVANGQFVHRLASDVLAHALLATPTTEPDPAAAEAIVTESLKPIWQAMNTVNEFFVARVYGYMRRHGVTRRESSPPE